MAKVTDKRNIIERVLNINKDKLLVEDIKVETTEAPKGYAGVNMVIGGIDSSTKTVLNTIDATQLDERSLFDLYRKMDTDSVISGALDLFADTATKINPKTGKIVYVKSGDKNFEDEINKFLHKQVHIDNEARGIVRNVLQFGKVFIDTGSPDSSDWVFMPVDQPEYIQALTKGHDKINYYVSQLVDEEKEDSIMSAYYVGAAKNALEFSISEPSRYISGFNGRVHKGEMIVQTESAITGEVTEESFKIRTGRSILESIISTWQTLATLEDSLFISRLVKSTAFNVVQIDVSGTNNTQRTQIINDVKAAFRSSETLDQVAQRYSNRQSPMPLNDFIYVPVQGERGSIVVNKVGGEIGEVDLSDIEYYNNKKFAGLGVLKAFLGWEETTPSGLGESPLTRLDERFSNRVIQVQHVLRQIVESIIKFYWEHSVPGRTEYNLPDYDITLGWVSTKEQEESRTALSNSLVIASDFTALALGDYGEFVNKEKLFRYVFDNIIGIDIREIDNTPIAEEVKVKIRNLKEHIEALDDEQQLLAGVKKVLEHEDTNNIKGRKSKKLQEVIVEDKIAKSKIERLKHKELVADTYSTLEDFLNDWDLYVEFKGKQPVALKTLIERPAYKRLLSEATYKQLKQQVKQADPQRVSKSKRIVGKYTGLDKDNYLTFTLTAEDPEKNRAEGKPTSYKGRVELKQLLEIIKDANGSIKDANIVRDAIAGDLAVSCTCPAATYWGQEYLGTKQGYSIVKNDIEPKRNLPTQVLCKHTYAMLVILPAWWNTITRDLRAKGILKPRNKKKADAEDKSTEANKDE